MLNAPRAQRPVQPGPGARALYLGSREHKRVSCTAEALVVTNARAQVMRYPVARLARIVSSADVVDWSGGALALCLRCGIGITWLDARGQSLGAAYPAQRNRTGFATALELMAERAEGLLRYRHWLRARRMEVLIRWGQVGAERIGPRQWEATKREWVYGGRFPLHLPVALRGYCMAYVAAQVAAHGLPPVLWGPDAQNIDLDEDLCELLWAEMNLGSGALADNTGADPELTVLFERWSTRNASALLLHITSLHRTAMKELVG